MSVLIVCPTGFLVHQYKSKLPDIDGIDNIRVDTIQGVLNYKRPGADSKVTWTPPSALKRIDLILMDEASQYADTEFLRFVQSVTEQPHRPFTGIVADFQQLQPIESGARMAAYCKQFGTVQLKCPRGSAIKPNQFWQRGIIKRQQKVVLDSRIEKWSLLVQ